MFIFTLVTYEPLVYNKTYKYPAWGEAIGWILALSSIVCIPVVGIINMMRASGDFIDVSTITSLTTTFYTAIFPDSPSNVGIYYMEIFK